ncbi:GspE/PulE family protein [Piscinibacter gummiphilus]|uniref:General secretion pathway protein GspE n=1 Tax=Piscinibacter gummiphilus TaxID=946333 RepID=A0A1W6L769_9BURK|nr:GspE/PulE family protein [Piscinibacter gummiphilus]ARN20020.1 general secretion pathway protein GspE [Piscinibacter gummiphilus]ATU64691.1 type II/IV secretion system protein [Piscinibacter gummiphilus]GLS94876.1 type II secretion system ATPase PulE [Piscinibacter gummiphilus]
MNAVAFDPTPDALTPELLASARTLAAQGELRLLAALAQVTGWTPDVLMQALARRAGCVHAGMRELQALVPEFERITYPECVARGVLVARDADGRRHVVLGDPFDDELEDWALRRLGPQPAPPVIAFAHPDDLQASFTQQERQLRAMDGFEGEAAAGGDEEVAAVITLSTISGDASPVVKLVNSTIYDALKLQASDIHLECDAGCLHVSYRIDGVLVPITQVHGDQMAEQVVSRIKVMAELDIAERRTPQDGRFKVRVNGREIDFRVSVMPNIFGEDAVLRLLDRQSLTEQAKSLRLDHLGLDAHTMTQVRRLAAKPHGMLLVTGPTGSGKTTTLYGAITEIHTGRDKIVTIEDPVEYRLPRVLQIPVNEKKGLTFARGLRSILRHDPDKIMVGEIRDNETAQIAVQAALTGHLVFTTVHANNVFDVVGRFVHMGVDAYSFAAALNGVVAQRLLRMNCPHCARPVEPSADELEAAGLDAERVRGWTFRAGAGCGHCRGAGYKGRKAVAEVLVLDDTMRELIAGRAPISALKERAAGMGLRPVLATALDWVARGETTLEEVARVAG